MILLLENLWKQMDLVKVSLLKRKSWLHTSITPHYKDSNVTTTQHTQSHICIHPITLLSQNPFFIIKPFTSTNLNRIYHNEKWSSHSGECRLPTSEIDAMLYASNMLSLLLHPESEDGITSQKTTIFLYCKFCCLLLWCFSYTGKGEGCLLIINSLWFYYLM
jgi:hypothetical protein